MVSVTWFFRNYVTGKPGAFENIPYNEIKWYYNKEQELQLNWSHLNKFRRRVE
jgi:hypothetical protein